MASGGLGSFPSSGSATVKVKIYDDSGSHRFKVWVDGTLEINITDSTFLHGGMAFGGPDAIFDNCKLGYDNNSDDDIDDPTDDIVWSDDFGGTSRTPIYDHAGNLIDDGTFVYVYDAWNRLVKVRAKEDADVTIQTAEFDALGRRIKKVVTNAGDYDKTEVYYYDGQRIVQINNGSGTMVQQFIHGTQYIDELVMMRVKDKGDLYVHQDANWNVIGTTDLGRHVVERDVYTPYGELTVHQETGFGDRDGDQDVDSTDKGTVGTTCTGTVSGACRILDLDFDGDYDSTDATKFDALTQGAMRHPGRPSTNVSQPFAHQGLPFEPELAQYQNRARQYDPGKRRFSRRDPLDIHGGSMSLFQYLASNPLNFQDPHGRELEGCTANDSIGTPCSIGAGIHICSWLRQRQEQDGATFWEIYGAGAVSFCCYTQNPVYGTLYCNQVSCWSMDPPPPPDACEAKHERKRLTQFGCQMELYNNQNQGCTEMKCKEVLNGKLCDLDCSLYTETYTCIDGGNLTVFHSCVLDKLCSQCKSIYEAKDMCKHLR